MAEQLTSLSLSRLGRYRVICELGMGGMASLYLGRSEGPGGFERLVAIKTIHPHLAKKKAFLDMFLDEARLAARIHHPNVVSVYEIGEEAGIHYLVMDYVSGETLALILNAGHLKQEPVPHPIAAHLLAAACEGLHAAHELRARDGHPLGVVHRDVSPQNLLVGYDGVVRVSDFGVAKAAGQLSSTEPGTRKGKFGYMAPEQIADEPLDRRSDVFAMGVVLWETTVGGRLFSSGNEFKAAQRILRGEIPLPSSRRADYPPALEAIVMRALARRPEDRYATTRELGIDLQGFVVKSASLIGVADVERFMLDRFPERRATRLEIERRATATLDEVPAGIFSELSHLLSLEENALEEQDRLADGGAPPDRKLFPELEAILAEPSIGAPRRRRLWPWASLAAVVLGIAGYLLISPREQEATADRTAVPVFAPVQPEAAATPTSAPPRAPPAAPREQVTLEFAITPLDAVLRLDGKEQHGPLVVARSNRRYLVEVAARGWRPYLGEVSAERSSVVRIHLEKSEPRRRLRPKKPPPSLLRGDDL